jgi:hypothetical protein
VFAVLSAALLGRLRRSWPPPLVAPAILAASPSMKVLPAAVLWILISHLSHSIPFAMPNAQCLMLNAQCRLNLDVEH